MFRVAWLSLFGTGCFSLSLPYSNYSKPAPILDTGAPSSDTGGEFSEDSGAPDDGPDPGIIYFVNLTGTSGYTFEDVVYNEYTNMYLFGAPYVSEGRGVILGLDPLSSDFGDFEVFWRGNWYDDRLGRNVSLLGGTHVGSGTQMVDWRGAANVIPMRAESGSVYTVPGAREFVGAVAGEQFGASSVVLDGVLYVSQSNPLSNSVWSVSAEVLADGSLPVEFTPVEEFASDPLFGGYESNVAMDLVASTSGILSISNGGYMQHVGTSDWYRREGSTLSGIPSDEELFSGRDSEDADSTCWGEYLFRTNEYAVTCVRGDEIETAMLNASTGVQNAVYPNVGGVVDASIGGVEVRVLSTKDTIRVMLTSGRLIREDSLPFGACLSRLAGDGAGHFAVLCWQTDQAAMFSLTL